MMKFVSVTRPNDCPAIAATEVEFYAGSRDEPKRLALAGGERVVDEPVESGADERRNGSKRWIHRYRVRDARVENKVSLAVEPPYCLLHVRRYSNQHPSGVSDYLGDAL